MNLPLYFRELSGSGTDSPLACISSVTSATLGIILSIDYRLFSSTIRYDKLKAVGLCKIVA